MRIIATLAFALLSQVCFANAQTPDEVKTDILAALSTPLPITVVGPMITRNVKVTPEGDGFRAVLEQPMLMGIIPLGSLSFKLTPASDKTYHVTDFVLPKTLEVLNVFKVAIGGTTFDGTWSTESRSYRKLNFELDNVSIVPKNSPEIKVQIGSIALDVAKQGDAGATESKFLLHASDISSKGFPPNNMSVKNVAAELHADGKEPVDLYSVLSRFVVLSSMKQGGGDSVLQFAESLRAQSYDNVALKISAENVEVTPTQTGSKDKLTIGSVSGAANLTNVTPDEWGAVAVNLIGKDIRDKGILDFKQADTEMGSISLTGTQIPIAAMLNAIGKWQALSRGEDASLKVSELLDGLFNMGAIKISSNASGIVYLPVKETDPSLHVGSYSLETGSDGFRDGKGRLFFSTGVDGLNWELKKFDNDVQKQTAALLNPKTIKYDVSVSELNESLLRKLMGDVTISSQSDYVALVAPAVTYVMAMKPVIESKDVHFQSADVDLAMSGLVRLYPAWSLGALPYEGENKISMKGYDKLFALLNVLKAIPPEPLKTSEPTDATPKADGDDSSVNADGDVPMTPDNRATYAVFQSALQTMHALSKSDGETLNWLIKYPKAGDALFVINDIELRFPNLGAAILPMLAGYGGLAGKH